MKNFERLNKNEMKMIMGGTIEDESIGGSANCFLRCNQDTTAGVEVTECSRATAESQCGEDLSNTVCVCTGVIVVL